ncbi:MAG: hypothetical protein HFK07_05835 [Clostridia bacterium]|jgi:KaiC/GvpD/RAD55 family RecA-like ATPase|nr:hypothetical protein [Clostridia bacterium]MCX4367690.1 hypothetical protein [Clostridia bacterium]
MINLIYGAKGSGKTKVIIDKANVTVSSGDTVFVTDTGRYMFDVKRDVRFINAKDFDIVTEAGFLGFVRGLLAGNSDIKHIFIDGAHRLVNKQITDMEDFYTKLDAIADKADIDVTLTVSMDKEEFPKFLKKYL